MLSLWLGKAPVMLNGNEMRPTSIFALAQLLSSVSSLISFHIHFTAYPAVNMKPTQVAISFCNIVSLRTDKFSPKEFFVLFLSLWTITNICNAEIHKALKTKTVFMDLAA